MRQLRRSLQHVFATPEAVHFGGRWAAQSCSRRLLATPAIDPTAPCQSRSPADCMPSVQDSSFIGALYPATSLAGCAPRGAVQAPAHLLLGRPPLQAARTIAWQHLGTDYGRLPASTRCRQRRAILQPCFTRSQQPRRDGRQSAVLRRGITSSCRASHTRQRQDQAACAAFATSPRCHRPPATPRAASRGHFLPPLIVASRSAKSEWRHPLAAAAAVRLQQDEPRLRQPPPLRAGAGSKDRGELRATLGLAVLLKQPPRR